MILTPQADAQVCVPVFVDSSTPLIARQAGVLAHDFRPPHSGFFSIFAGGFAARRITTCLRRFAQSKLQILGRRGSLSSKGVFSPLTFGRDPKTVAVSFQPQENPCHDKLPAQRNGWKLFVAVALLSVSFSSFAGEIRLAVAHSTCTAIKKVGELYRKVDHHVQLTYICKSSGLLAKGMSGGALSADIFVSADKEWMDFAVKNKLVSEKEVMSPWGNTLVVAVPAHAPLKLLDLTEITASKVSSVMIGDPSTAPFGRYAKQALESSGLWEAVQGKITTRKNIELLVDGLADAESGTVGILFKSNMDERLREVAAVKASLHQPIEYFLAPLDASASHPDVRKFLKFLTGPTGKAVFLAENFNVNP